MSLRSSISKNCLICLDEILTKFKKKMEPYLESVMGCLLKKIVYANEFLQEEIRKCFRTVTQYLADSKLVHLIYERR